MSRTKITSMAVVDWLERSVISVVLEIFEALILIGRALERAAFFARLPLHDILYFSGQCEVLFSDAFGGVRDQLDDYESIGNRKIRMVPRGFGEMANGIDYHQRGLPAAGFEFAANPSVFVIPVRQFDRQSLFDFSFSKRFFG